MESLSERLRFARLASGLSQRAVAEHFGIARVSVTQWEGAVSSPERDKIPELAALYNTTADWLLEGVGTPPQKIENTALSGRNRARPSASDVRVLDTFRPEFSRGEDLVLPERLPIYAAAAGGDGHVIVTFDAIEWVKRPSVLENVRNGYGILIVNTSMVPAYRPGDMALINPNLMPMRDTDVVLYHVPPDGQTEAEALVKQLNGWSDREWHLEQFSPARTFAAPRADWPICHRVVGKYNRR